MKQTLRVLLVGYSESDALYLFDKLKQQEFDPLYIRVHDRFAMGKTLDETPCDLILCDAAVPNFSPMEALGVLHEKKKDLPFIVISSADDEPIALDALRGGAHDYLIKEKLERLGPAIRRELSAARTRVDQKKAQEAIEKRIAAFETKEKTLRCLHALSRLVRDDIPFEQIFKQMADIIPTGWQYPEIACARVCFDDGAYSSDPFIETPWRQASPIVVHGAVRGSIEVCYTEARAVSDEGPFLTDERALLDELAMRVGDAIERLSAEARVDHLSTVLRAIRNVNRLIVRGENPGKLVEQACSEIVSNRGLQSAWVYLNRDAPGGQLTLERGWGEAFLPLADYLKAGNLPRCCQQALEVEGVVTTRDPLTNCLECALSAQYDVNGLRPSETLSTAIRIDERTYGFMCVAISPDLATEEEKESLLKEVADDIAFALRGIEIESNRSRAEADLKKEALRRHVLMNASRDGICIFNQEHQIVEANQRFAEMLGYTPQELLSLHTWDLEAVMTEADVRVAFADLTQTYATFETRHRRKDGTVYDVEVSASGARVGDEPMVFTVSRDITEKKNIQANLAQSDRLSCMGMLAAGVAHEINNPLAYVLYHLETLSKDIPDLADQMRHYREVLDAHLEDSNLRRMLRGAEEVFTPLQHADIANRFQEALEGTRRIHEIARALGTFSRVERHQLVPVNIHYTIECAANMAFNEIKYRARFVKDFGLVSRVMASEGHLSQVFLNLLINAAHAVEEGDVEGNEIRVRTWQEEEEVCVEVRDTGKGISKENLDRIYEPFFTTKSIGVGSGLGLTISRNIIDGYGGRIDIQSEEGKGTSFFIRIPIKQPIVEQPASVKEEAPMDQPASGRILVIDDEVGILNTLKRMLKGHEVVTASSGVKGRAIIEADQKFDLILCDMMMPAMSGMELHEWLADAYPDLAKQFIFMTGGAFTPKSRDYLARVDNLRVNKPFDPTGLVKQVSEIVAAHRKGLPDQPRD